MFFFYKLNVYKQIEVETWVKVIILPKLKCRNFKELFFLPGNFSTIITFLDLDDQFQNFRLFFVDSESNQCSNLKFEIYINSKKITRSKSKHKDELKFRLKIRFC